MSELPSEACHLHKDIFIALDREIAKGTPEYNRFECIAGPYLGEGDVAKCSSMIDLLKKMQTCGVLKVGDYKDLKDMLSQAGLCELREMVEKREVEIVKILGKCGDETGTSRTVDSQSPPDGHTGPATVLTGGISVQGNQSNVKINVGNQSNVAAKTDVERVKEESKNFQEQCKSKIKDLHVETQPCIKARSQLTTQQTILLVGNSGDGKSSTLDCLAADPLPGYHPIPCSGSKDIEKYINLVTTTLLLLFICDEPFGSSYTQQQLVDIWINKGKKLDMRLKNHKFVFATRKSVWNECEILLHKIPFFCNLLDVSSETLTKEDKQKMLEKYQGESENLREREKTEIVHTVKPIAYAQCCKLMSDAIKCGHTGKKLVEIFKRPFTFLSEEIEIMAKKNKAQYATLCLIMLCGGELECEELSDITDDEVKERMGVVVGVYDCTQLDLQTNAKSLSGTYLVKTHKKGNDSCDIYRFSHDSIAEAVTMKFGQDHFRHCLKYLKRDVVVNIVRSKTYKKGEQEFAINVPTRYYAEITPMFTQTVIDANGSWGLGGVCKNPCVADEQFQSVWIDYLTKTSLVNLAPFCQSKAPGGWCVLFYLAEAGADKLVRYLCEHRQTHTLTCDCRREHMLPCPIGGAVIGGQTEIFAHLLTVYRLNQKQVRKAVYLAYRFDKVRVLERLLTSDTLNQMQVREAVDEACRFDNVRVLKVLLPQIHEDREETIKGGLVSACVWGSVNTVRYLLSEVCTPCEGDKCGCVEGLLAASQRSHTDIVRVIRSSGHKGK